MITHENFDLQRLNAIPITGVAQRLDSVRRAGVNYVTSCPWHDDKHPSLTLYERTDENRCHCFACGKGGRVIDYVMQHEGWNFKDACRWLSSAYGISTTPITGPIKQPKPKPRPKSEEPVVQYIPSEMLDDLVSTENSLCKCLMQIFHPEAVAWVVEHYRIGTYSYNSHDDYTVFPNIDAKGRVCNLKIQLYDTDSQSPRFAHSHKGCCYWLGRIWVREGRLPKEAEFHSDCLFGEHLLSRYPESNVVLVESPKNALFGALAFPQSIWLATGNKNQLKRSVLAPLQGRNVIVMPDRDAVDEWKESISKMADIANFVVSDFCRRMAPEGQPKYDIADYLQQQRFSMPF